MFISDAMEIKPIFIPLCQYLYDDEDEVRKKKPRRKLTSAASITRANVSNWSRLLLLALWPFYACLNSPA